MQLDVECLGIQWCYCLWIVIQVRYYESAFQAVRPIVIGRKEWLFATSVDGANASANLYSLVETAKANGHEPHSYIHHVLTQLPAAKTLEDIECLLPFNLQPQERLTA